MGMLRKQQFFIIRKSIVEYIKKKKKIDSNSFMIDRNDFIYLKKKSLYYIIGLPMKW